MLCYEYYNISNVTEYYDYTDINYLLMIVGAVVAIKTLYFSCFGMVIRLYKCAVLFIIAPAVIGMTPINEGGLGKWRTSFIGQVLSAYGTILSLNLYFLIVRVLINIDISFVYPGGGGSSPFSTSLMSGLLKCIFVLAGSIMVEKFAKEIGGYFGAEDAVSAGKDMSKQMGDMAMKGIATAAMVATTVASGGAGLAVKGAGLAAKMAAGAKAGAAGKAGLGKVVGGVKGAFTTQGMRDKANYKNAMEATKGLRADSSKLGEEIQEKQATIDKHQQTKEMLDKRKAGGIKLNADEEKALKDANKFLTKDKAKVEAEIEKKKGEKRLKDAAIDTYSGQMDPYLDRQAERGRKRMDFISGVYGMAEQGKKNIPGMGYLDQFAKARETGAKKLGDPFIAAHDSIEYNKGKKVQDKAADVYKGLIMQQNAAGAREVVKQTVKEAEFMQAKIVTNASYDIQNLAEILSKTKDKDEQTKAIEQYRQRINASGANLTFEGLRNMVMDGDNVKKIDANVTFTASDFKIDFDPKIIQRAVNEAIAKGGNDPNKIREAIVEVLQDLGAKGNANMIKIISDLIEKKIGELKK